MTYWECFKTLFYDVFVASLGAYLGVLAAESFSRGIVTSVIHINALLLVCAVSGILVIVFPPQKQIGRGVLDYLYTALFALFAGVLTLQTLGAEQPLVFILAPVVSLIVLLFLLSAKMEPSKE